MSRSVDRLTLDDLAQLPGGCATCVFWELDAVRRGQVRGREAEEKAAWASQLLREWGSIGRVIRIDGEIAGHILWAPALHLPGSLRFATAPASADAVLLASAHVDPRHRGGGLGRVLIQSMAKDVMKRGGINAIEAFGALRARPEDCVLPADFLLAVGFRTHRPHPRYPRMRMDLRAALTWREEFEVAAERLLGAVSGKRRPSPAAPTPRQPSVTRSGQPADSARIAARSSLSRSTPVLASDSALR